MPWEVRFAHFFRRLEKPLTNHKSTWQYAYSGIALLVKINRTVNTSMTLRRNIRYGINKLYIMIHTLRYQCVSTPILAKESIPG